MLLRSSREGSATRGGALRLLLVLWVGVGCGQADETPSPEASAPEVERRSDALAEVAYVGDEACASCHEDLYTSYHRTGMGRSVSRFDPATAPERFGDAATVYDPKTAFYYQPFVRGDTLFQREYRLGEDGEVTYERIHAADWVVGSGNATRSYLMNTNGYVSEMPLTWYVERGLWDLSPGYEQKNLRFSRPIVPECMTCHNGLPEHTPFTPDHYTDVPLGITCERCHGPGEAHVEKHLEGLGEEDQGPDASIVNPAHLGRDLQLATCQQCHLTGTTVFAPGEDAAAYRPGQPLEANRAVFVAEARRDDPERFGIASHAERLALSACFQESAMTCTTCHDPHQPVAELGADTFNRVCQSCHGGTLDANAPDANAPDADILCARPEVDAPAEAMTGDCVSCHLQKSGTSDIPHVTFTDHWIRPTLPPARAPEEIERMQVRDTPFTLVRMTAPPADAAQADLEEAIAYFQWYDTDHQLPDYLPIAVRHARRGLTGGADHVEARLALGRALAEQDSLTAAENALAAAAERYPDHPEVLYWLGEVRLRQGRPRAALAPLERAVTLQPAYVDARTKWAEALDAAGRPGEAIEAYREALRRDPVHHPEAWNNLGFLLLQSGRPGEATEAFDMALALAPDLAPALVNAGSVRLQRRELEAAAALFRRALEVDASYVPALGNLGLIYAQQGRYADALPLFEQAVRLQPGDVRARAMLEQVAALAAQQDDR